MCGPRTDESVVDTEVRAAEGQDQRGGVFPAEVWGVVGVILPPRLSTIVVVMTPRGELGALDLTVYGLRVKGAGQIESRVRGGEDRTDDV